MSGSSARRTRAREAALRAVLVLGALAAGLALAEVGLRLAGVAHPVFYRVDEHRGWALLPGAEGWWDAEGGARVRINRDGMRDRDHPQAKPDGTYRIAVLGDSFTAAFQLPAEQAFWSVLERQLTGCPQLRGRTVEVLNFGVSNYGTAHELLTFRHHARRYEPDLVLLALFTGNDIHDNAPAFHRGGNGPYFELRDGALALDTSFRNSARYRLRISIVGRLWYRAVRSSRVLQLGRQAVRAVRVSGARTEGSPNRFPDAGLAIYREPDEPEWREAWQVTERLLPALRDETRDAGARLAVVTLSNPEQVHPDRERRERLARSLGVEDLGYPDRRLRELGQREGLPVLNLAPLLAGHAERTGEFLHGFRNPGHGHWNERGHRIAGERIAAWLCDGRL